VRSALVIGYGNSLRGDDGIGVAVAEQLSETLQTDLVKVIACQQLTPELASQISSVDRVIMIDAAQGDTPGKISVNQIEPDADSATFTHELQPSTLLACSQELYGKCPETFLVSVTGYSFEFSDELSDTLTRVMPKVLARIRELIDRQDA
jgi:hydrogenase maturation protease